MPTIKIVQTTTKTTEAAAKPKNERKNRKQSARSFQKDQKIKTGRNK